MSLRENTTRKPNRSSVHHYARGVALAAVLVSGPMSCVGRTVLDGGPWDGDATDGNPTGGRGSGGGSAIGTGAGPSDGGRASWGDGGGSSDFTDDLVFVPTPSDGGSHSDGGGGSVTGDGGAAGGTGMGGIDGQGPGCNLPFESGACQAAFPVFFHNTDTGLCEPAVYGGCGGNENRFETLEQCEASCLGE